MSNRIQSCMEQGGAVFLVRLEEGELLDLAVLDRLADPPAGVAACRMQMRGDHRFLEYSVAGFSPLSRLAGTEWRKKQFLTVAENLASAFQSAAMGGVAERFLPAGLEMAMVNPSGKALLIAIPLQNRQEGSLAAVVQEMVFRFSFPSDEDNSYVGSFLSLCREKRPPDEFLRLAGSLRPAPAPQARYYDPQPAHSGTTLIADAAVMQENLRRQAEAEEKARAEEARRRAEAEEKARAEEARRRAEAEEKARAEEARRRAEAEEKARAEEARRQTEAEEKARAEEARRQAEAEEKARAEEARRRAEAEEKARAEEARRRAEAEEKARAEEARRRAEAEEKARAEEARRQTEAEEKARAEEARRQAEAEEKARAEEARRQAEAEEKARAEEARRRAGGPEGCFLRRDRTGEVMHLDGEEYIIGRPSSMDYRAAYPNARFFPIRGNTAVGRLHARLSLEGGKWVLRDLGSLNHTWVNGRKLESGGEAALQPGDRLKFADEAVTFGKD